MAFKSGFISIIGRPNTGKSTLLNAVLGEKIAIVSRKPQTTRTRIRGVKNLEDCQMVFIDTPGIHRARGPLNEFMVKEAVSTLRDVDCIIFLVEATRPAGDDELLIIKNFRNLKTPVVLAINKVDRVRKDELLPLIDRYSKLFPFRDIVPLSALTGDGVDELLDTVRGLLPEGPKYFPDDIVSDQPERFIVAEFIREKVFEFTREEIPYSVAVTVESFKEDRNKNLVSISAVITVEKDSQKGIIIGRGGAMLKRIGTAARLDIERFLQARVYLELFVRVRKDWTKSPRALKEFGYR